MMSSQCKHTDVFLSLKTNIMLVAVQLFDWRFCTMYKGWLLSSWAKVKGVNIRKTFVNLLSVGPPERSPLQRWCHHLCQNSCRWVFSVSWQRVGMFQMMFSIIWDSADLQVAVIGNRNIPKVITFKLSVITQKVGLQVHVLRAVISFYHSPQNCPLPLEYNTRKSSGHGEKLLPKLILQVACRFQMSAGTTGD